MIRKGRITFCPFSFYLSPIFAFCPLPSALPFPFRAPLIPKPLEFVVIGIEGKDSPGGIGPFDHATEVEDPDVSDGMVTAGVEVTADI